MICRPFQCLPVDSIRRINTDIAPLPLCLEYDARYKPPRSEIRWPTRELEVAPNGRDSVLIFSIDSLRNDLCCAQRQWACVCGVENTACACTVKVRFVTDSLRESEYEEDRRIYHTFDPVPREGRLSFPTAKAADCGPIRKCDTASLIIWLNARSDWMHMSRNWRVRMHDIRRFYVNCSLLGNAAKVSDDTIRGYGWYDLCLILMHELGHLYGMYHHDFWRCDTTYRGVMMAEVYRSSGFTEDDRCIFAKLYCPELVGVQEAARQETTSGGSILCIQVPEGGARVKVDIYSLYGTLVLQLPERYHAGGQLCEELPAEKLATGVYACVVSVGNKLYRQLAIIVR